MKGFYESEITYFFQKIYDREATKLLRKHRSKEERKKLCDVYEKELEVTLKLLIEPNTKRTIKRKRFQIFRLHQQSLFTVHDLADLFGIPKQTIRGLVGQTFRTTCARNKCWAEPFLKR